MQDFIFIIIFKFLDKCINLKIVGTPKKILRLRVCPDFLYHLTKQVSLNAFVTEYLTHHVFMLLCLQVNVCVSLSSPLVFIPRRVTSWKYVWILCQCCSNFLLLLKPSRVGHLDMAAFVDCRFIHYSLQSSIQLRTENSVLCSSDSGG